MDKLLPCPFCLGKCGLVNTNGAISGTFWVRCDSCGYEGRSFRGAEADGVQSGGERRAIEWHNRRPDAPKAQEGEAGAAVPAREALIPELYCIALGYEMRPGEFEEAKKDKGWMEYWNKQSDRILALLPTKASEGTVPQGGPARDALEKLAKVALKVAESAKGPKVVHDISIFDLADLEKLALAALLGAGGDRGVGAEPKDCYGRPLSVQKAEGCKCFASGPLLMTATCPVHGEAEE